MASYAPGEGDNAAAALPKGEYGCLASAVGDEGVPDACRWGKRPGGGPWLKL